MMTTIGKLERWFRFVTEEGFRHKRWGKMRVSRPESVLEHSVKQTYLSILMYHLEGTFGNPHGLNLLGGPLRAVSHDLDELIEGDIILHEKVKNKAAAEAKARHDFEVILAQGIPQKLQGAIDLPYDLDPNAAEAEQLFWAACESIGYALFALEEIREAMKLAYVSTDFDETLVREWDSVVYFAISQTADAAKRFRSVSTFRRAVIEERERIVPSDLIIGNDAEHDRIRDEILAR